MYFTICAKRPKNQRQHKLQEFKEARMSGKQWAKGKVVGEGAEEIDAGKEY